LERPFIRQGEDMLQQLYFGDDLLGVHCSNTDAHRQRSDSEKRLCLAAPNLQPEGQGMPSVWRAIACPRWTGWFRERCCWNRPLLVHKRAGRLRLQRRAEFEALDCEAFAHTNWHPLPIPKAFNHLIVRIIMPLK
jgi:hypothetical protein